MSSKSDSPSHLHAALLHSGLHWPFPNMLMAQSGLHLLATIASSRHIPISYRHAGTSHCGFVHVLEVILFPQAASQDTGHNPPSKLHANVAHPLSQRSLYKSA